METDPNPFASPTNPAANKTSPDKSNGCPQLPLILRPPLAERTFASIFGCILAIGSVFAIKAAIRLFSFPLTLPLAILSTLIAAASFAGAIIFLSSIRSKVIADTNQLQVQGTKCYAIAYHDIESWHIHPATGAIQLMIAGHSTCLAVPSWPISTSDSDSLRAVLRTHVGQPDTRN